VGAASAATSACDVVTDETASAFAVVTDSAGAGTVVGPVVPPVLDPEVVAHPEAPGSSVGSASASGSSGVPVGSSVLVLDPRLGSVGDVLGDVLGEVLGVVLGDVVSVGAVVDVVGVGVSTGVVAVAPGVVMTVVTCSTTVGVATSATSLLAALAATVTRASTTGALYRLTMPAVARVDETATGTVAARAGARLLRKTWVVTALTSSGEALPAVAAVAALRASFAAEETADRTARSTAGVRRDSTVSSWRGFITADSEELTALTTICRAELAWVSVRSPIATMIGVVPGG
jgi:hypothetical protein